VISAVLATVGALGGGVFGWTKQEVATVASVAQDNADLDARLAAGKPRLRTSQYGIGSALICRVACRRMLMPRHVRLPWVREPI
jgi:hypothetical protein